MTDVPPPLRMFGIPFTPLGLDAAAAVLARRAGDAGTGPCIVVTPNVDHVVRTDRDPDLMARYRQADMFLVDGAPVLLASRLLGTPLPGRATGADLMPRLLATAASTGRRVVVVGGRPGLESADAACLRDCFPQLDVTVIAPGMAFDPTGELADRIAATVATLKPAYIFVCVGFPRQEMWALAHREFLDGSVVLCCGAALDFLVGRVRRAPAPIRRLGLEWAWRLLSEPRRLWRRYLVDDVAFLGIVLREWRRRRREGA